MVFRLGELWDYRELLYFLIWRDLKVRYRQTVLGASWAVLQPLFTMLIFALFFGRFAGIPSDGAPYPVFAFAALVPWMFFAQGLTLSSSSLVANQALLRKVYFPRLVIPSAIVASNLIDFFLAFLVLLAMMVYYGLAPGAHAGWLPLSFAITLATTLAAGLWLSALNVLYRDVQYVTPFLVQVWLFSTPIVYSSSLVPERWRMLYALNPMAGAVEGFRWALLGTDTPASSMMFVSAIAALALLVGGVWFFRRVERSFSDVV